MKNIKNIIVFTIIIFLLISACIAVYFITKNNSNNANMSNKEITQIDKLKTYLLGKNKTGRNLWEIYNKDSLEFLDDSIIVAHNAQFDLNFLNAECENCGLPVTKNHAVDTLQLSRILIPESQYHKLDYLADYLDIDKGSSHRALDDAITCMELFKKCLERR